jgi:hypothetical protein
MSLDNKAEPHGATPTASSCVVNRSAERRFRRTPWLDPDDIRMERSTQPTGNATPADIDRNGRPTSIGMGGRHQVGITGRLRRNAPLNHPATLHRP